MASSSSEPESSVPTITATDQQSTSATNLLELNETVSRMLAHTGVVAVQILNRQGDVVVERQTTTSSSNHSESQDSDVTAAAARTKALWDTARAYISATDETDEISFVTLRSKGGYELMMAPHEGYCLAVLKR